MCLLGFPQYDKKDDGVKEVLFIFFFLFFSDILVNLVMNPSTSKLFSLLESKATYTVEEAIDKIGYGPFQVKLMLVIGLAWVSFSKGLLQDSLMIIFLL